MHHHSNVCREDLEVIIPLPTAPWWHRAIAHEVLRGQGSRLDRAALLLSAHRSTYIRGPGDIELYMANLDDLAHSVQPPTIDSWQRTLFVQLGLSGNGENYHDVRNSFLPDVLERRVGIPIALAVLGIAVAQRLDLPMWGVGMPGHFLLGTASKPATADDPIPEGTQFIDPFHAGTMLSAAECADRFWAMFPGKTFDRGYLSPTDTTHILVRMLANLKSNYARGRDLDGLAAVMRLRSCLPGMTGEEARELVRLLDVVGDWEEASNALDQCCVLAPDQNWTIERDRLDARLN